MAAAAAPNVVAAAGAWRKGLLCAAIALLVFAGSDLRAEKITGAKYDVPVARYGHFALGRPHEYARLTVTTDGGRELALELPLDEVFEDLVPRLVKFTANEQVEILAIVSGHGVGARLAVISLRDGALVISAQSLPIGTPMRWLNPVGVVDLDGDGRAEIAAVITPHIGGTLKVFRRVSRGSGDRLEEIAALGGFSNHEYGSPELALSTPVSFAGRIYMMVPDVTRRQLRLIALQGDRLAEVGRCALASRVVGAIKPLSPREVSVVTQSGTQVVALADCLKR